MDEQTAARLLALNRDFYTNFAQSFSASRPAGRLNMEAIAPYLHGASKVLDVGCGNGRLADRLDHDGWPLHYVGVDAIPELIAIAAARQPRLRHLTAEFLVADITVPSWAQSLRDHAPFDTILLLAVLHHIPGGDGRRAVLDDLHALLRPGGILLMSNWQFTHSERLRRKIVPWGEVGINESDVEPGDALLSWRRGGVAHRYCHWLTEAEVESLAAQSGFQVIAQFYAEANLNLYSALTRIA
ncbi:MAG: class I SAM-dependent methyltransferase [Chloroflexi bacterium]|nr:class I SAM-dependent methyltransferase [Chloroflexota bacterium]